MRVRHLGVSITAAVVMGAFGPVLAQSQSTDVTVKPNISGSANVGGGASTDQSVSGGASASGSTSTQSSTSAQSSTDMQAGASAGASASEDEGRKPGKRKARGHDPDKKTGLDRADEAAGEHGQQGRDNARAHRERK